MIHPCRAGVKAPDEAMRGSNGRGPDLKEVAPGVAGCGHVNVLGHTFVALASGDDEPYLLGAVLPDLASMVGVRLDRSRLDGRVAQGVRAHVAADAAFHAHPAFRAGVAALRRDLAARGFDRGPARAISHAGWEMLLDGTLVGSPAEAAYRRALGAGDIVLDAVAEPDRPRWLGFVRRAAASGPQLRLRYEDPTWVAERLHDLLNRRPRLRFPAHRRSAVARALGHHAGPVATAAPDLLAATRNGTTPAGNR
jgi:hypothetical protein